MLGVGDAHLILDPMKTVYGMYSSYTHATSLCAMEMYDGRPPRWQLVGNLTSAFLRDHQFDIRNQYFRGATSFAIAALMFNRPLLFQKAMSMTEDFMSKTQEQV